MKILLETDLDDWICIWIYQYEKFKIIYGIQVDNNLIFVLKILHLINGYIIFKSIRIESINLKNNYWFFQIRMWILSSIYVISYMFI